MDNNEQPRPSPPGQAIAARIVIGVTGHRELKDRSALAAAVRTALDNIMKTMPVLHDTPLVLDVLSPLAEGADRLVAEEILKFPDAALDVVLPLEKEDYMEDFRSDASRKEFTDLLAKARSVKTLPPRRSRAESYEQAGRYIIERCDVLIALWDGKPAAGRGGTEEIIRYARVNHCPLVWINTEDPSQVTFELGQGLAARSVQDLDKYNAERVDPAVFQAEFTRNKEFFTARAEQAGLPAARFRRALEYMLRHYVRADILALHYQHVYYRAETLVSALALVAVIIATFQVLFIPDLPIILVSEILLMFAVLGIVWAGRRRHWHNKWIDYRFLAERFRSALFMSAADIDVAMLRPPRHLSLAYEPKDWMVLAFTSVWACRPRNRSTDAPLFQEVKSFLCEAWVNDQIRFHDATHRRHYRRHRSMTIAGYVLFSLTIVVAILHIVRVGPHLLESVFAFLAVVFPAIAATITAVRTHRDYLRTSMRSGEMARQLKELKERIDRVNGLDEFLPLIKEIEETMLHENEDWRVIVRFHIMEPV
jgi:uncharacterized membrane protein YoaK (UPF0700 family)